MYTDDIIILSSSIVELQMLVNISTENLLNLGMSVNGRKSVCMRVGPTYNLEIFGIVIDSTPVPWNPTLRYLEQIFLTGKSFMCDLHPIESKFFAFLNILLQTLTITLANHKSANHTCDCIL